VPAQKEYHDQSCCNPSKVKRYTLSLRKQPRAMNRSVDFSLFVDYDRIDIGGISDKL